MSIVEKLRKSNSQVYVTHYRYYWVLEKCFPQLKLLTIREARLLDLTDYAIPFGGKTTIKIVNGEDDPVYTATSVCRDEPYVKKVGVQMAYKALCKKYPNVFKEIEENVCS